MYVCICHGVTDRDIRTAAKNGACSLEALGEQLNIATGCGRCADCAKEVLQEVLQPSVSISTITVAA